MLRSILNPIFTTFGLAVCLSLSALPVPAATQDEVLDAALLSGAATDRGTRMAGLHLRLAPGWKTYWRAPGDTGIPPVFDWSRSDNVAAIRLHWPRPTVFLLNGMKSIGYHDDVVLPLEVTPRDAARPITLRLSADLGVCKDICMPASLQIEAALQDDSGDDAIGRAMADMPTPARQAGVGATSCQLEPIRDGMRISARMVMPALAGDETVVFEPNLPGVWVSEAETTRQGDTLLAVAEMVPPQAKPFAIERGKITLTVIGQDRAVEIQGCPAP